MNCAFTGNRPKGLPWGYNELKENCINFKIDAKNFVFKLISRGYTHFYTGMAEGFDMIGAEIVLILKYQFPNIKLTAVIPCRGQEKFWSKPQQKRYYKILSQCDETIILSEDYTPTCMNERNKYLVDHCDAIFAAYNGKAGGTRNTLNYAKENNKSIFIIDVNKFRK